MAPPPSRESAGRRWRAVGDQVVFRFGLETPDLLGARPHAVILDGETMPYVDVTAITMLEQLAGDLERSASNSCWQRDIGTVRDVLERAQDTNATLPTYPTVPSRRRRAHRVTSTGPERYRGRTKVARLLKRGDARLLPKRARDIEQQETYEIARHPYP